MEWSLRGMEHFSETTPANCHRSNTASNSEPNYPQKVGSIRRIDSIRLPDTQESEVLLLPCSQTSIGFIYEKKRSTKCVTSSTERSISTLDSNQLDAKPCVLLPSFPTDHFVDGQLIDRMGSSVRKQLYCPREVVSRRENYAHKPVRNTCSSICNTLVSSDESSCSAEDRQRDSKICNQQRRISFSKGTFRSESSNRGMLSEEYFLDSKENSKSHECDGRFSKQGYADSNGMATSERSFSENTIVARSIGNRHDGYTSEYSTSQIRSSIFPSKCRGDGRSYYELEQMETNLPVSTQKLHSSDDEKITTVQLPWSNNSTLESCSSVVLNNTKTEQRPSAHQIPIRAMGARRVNTIRLKNLRKMDRIQFLAHLWRNLYGRSAASMLCKAHRPSTIRQAESAWKCFKDWLPNTVTVLRKKHLLDFLIFLQRKKKLSPKTILGYRNSLALPIRLAFKINLNGEHFRLLTRSQFIAKPPRNKIIPQWSLNHVLETFSAPRFKNKTAAFRDLFLKSLFLIALATGNRVSELASATRIGIIISDENVEIPVRSNFLFKNQELGRSPPPIVFPALGPLHPLCPRSVLVEYLKKTSELPPNGHIFLHPETGKPLSAGRLSYWLSVAIKLSDASLKAKGHDVRKMSFSTAWATGVPLDQIVKNGFWKSPNVFINKYLVTTEAPTFSCVAGRSIVNGRQKS